MIEQMQQGQQWLEELLQLMGFPAGVKAKPETEVDPTSAYWLIIDEADLTPDQIEMLVGKRGETIDAIQYLANSHLNLGLDRDKQRAITVEVNGYRIQRQAELQELAQKVAQEVRETGQEVRMQSLSSAERRQIHSFLEASPDLITHSEGNEPDRHLIVRLRG